MSSLYPLSPGVPPSSGLETFQQEFICLAWVLIEHFIPPAITSASSPPCSRLSGSFQTLLRAAEQIKDLFGKWCFINT